MTSKLLDIEKLFLVDPIRAGVRRLPGACRTLRNTAPNIAALERLRSGYQAYTDVTAPTGMEMFRIVPISIPSEENLFVWYYNSGGKKIGVNRWWMASIKQTTNKQINESISFTHSAGSVATNTVTVTGADALGLSSTNDYYNGWVMKNTTQNLYGLITDYSYSSAASGTATFTLIETLTGGDSYGWVVGNSYTLYLAFHDNLGFSPTYNTDIPNQASYPIQDNGIIYLSGGCGSSSGLRGLWINPHLKRTFFPSEAKTVTFEGFYASEERLKAYDFRDLNAGQPAINFVSSTDSLPDSSNYFLGIACEYDNNQVGELLAYESSSEYAGASNFVSSGSTVKIRIPISVNVATLNKRITGLRVYLARDPATTSSFIRQDSYYYVKRIPFTESWFTDFGYTGGTQQAFTLNVDINGTEYNNALSLGKTYTDDSGMPDLDWDYSDTVANPLDTSFSYSIREVIGQRHYISNVYLAVDATTNREDVFTNPYQTSETFGTQIATSLFPNFRPNLRFPAQPELGTKINGIVPLDVGSFLVLKDRGVLYGSILTLNDGSLDIAFSIITEEDGCASLNGWCKDNYGRVYFAGYNDIYRIEGNQVVPLIARGDKNDWLWTYREMTSANKEALSMFNLPTSRCIIFCFGNTSTLPTSYNGLQYAYYYDEPVGWREVRFGESSNAAQVSFKYVAYLQDGTAVGLNVPITGSASMKKFVADYFKDDTIDIVPEIDAYKMLVSGELDKDFVLEKVVFDQDLNAPLTGQLDVDLMIDDNFVRFQDCNRTVKRLEIVPNIRRGDPITGRELSLDFNTNLTNRARLNGGTIWGLNGIQIYGELRDRKISVGERVGAPTAGYVWTGGTISGRREIIVNATPTTFTFDEPFRYEGFDLNGNPVPAYRFFVTYAKVNSTDQYEQEILITARDLNTITLISTENNTLVKFVAYEPKPLVGTVNGRFEALVGTTPTVLTFDRAFTQTYTGIDGATSLPAYFYGIESARVGSNQYNETVNILAKSLTSITLISTSANTLVKFAAFEYPLARYTVNGIPEVYLDTIGTAKTFDTAFTETYTDLSSNSAPLYRLLVEGLYSNGNRYGQLTPEIVNQTYSLSQFTIQATENNTILKYICL